MKHMEQPFLRATRKDLGGKTADKGAEQIRAEGASLPFQGPHRDPPLPAAGLRVADHEQDSGGGRSQKTHPGRTPLRHRLGLPVVHFSRKFCVIFLPFYPVELFQQLGF